MKLPRRRHAESSPAAPDDEAPGWEAIDAALTPHYGPEPARHVGFLPPAAFSTNLQGCSAYAADGHWFYVTYGPGVAEAARPPESGA